MSEYSASASASAAMATAATMEKPRYQTFIDRDFNEVIPTAWAMIYAVYVTRSHTLEQFELVKADPDAYAAIITEANAQRHLILINGAGDKRQEAYPAVMDYVNQAVQENGYKGGMITEATETSQEKKDGSRLFPEYQEVYKGFGLTEPTDVVPNFSIGGGNSRINYYTREGFVIPEDCATELAGITSSFDKLGAREDTNEDKTPKPPTEEQLAQLEEFHVSSRAYLNVLASHGLWDLNNPVVSDGAFGNVIVGKAKAPRFINLWEEGSENYMSTTLGKMYARSCQALGLKIVLQNRSYLDQKTGKNHARQALREHNEVNPEHKCIAAIDYSSSQCVWFVETEPGKIIRVHTTDRAAIDKDLMNMAYPDGWGQKKK